MIVSDNLQLFEVHFIPQTPSKYPPVIFVPGWGSFINSWEIVLKEMTKHFEIFYVETREKGSAKHNPEQPITIQEIGKDLARVIELKDLTKDSFIMFGSSMGATAIIESILNNNIKPSLAVLIGPNMKYKIPRIWIYVITLLPDFLYGLIKPLAKYYMKKKYIDMNSDSEQFKKYSYVLDNIHFERTKRAVHGFKNYSLSSRILEIKQRTVIFSGKKDALHNFKDAVEMNNKIKNSKLFNLETNHRTHSKEMVDLLRDYLDMNKLFK